MKMIFLVGDIIFIRVRFSLKIVLKYILRP